MNISGVTEFEKELTNILTNILDEENPNALQTLKDEEEKPEKKESSEDFFQELFENEEKFYTFKKIPKVLDSIESKILDVSSKKTYVIEEEMDSFQQLISHLYLNEQNILNYNDERRVIEKGELEKQEMFIIDFCSFLSDIIETEPIFFTCYLYNLSTGTKLSEDFDFELNKKDILLQNEEKYYTNETPKGIFSIYEFDLNIVMIIKGKKLYSLNGKTIEQTKEYFKKKNKQSPDKLDLDLYKNYHQSVFFSYIPIFRVVEEKQVLILNEGPLNISEFYFFDNSKELNIIKFEKENKKYKENLKIENMNIFCNIRKFEPYAFIYNESYTNMIVNNGINKNTITDYQIYTQQLNNIEKEFEKNLIEKKSEISFEKYVINSMNDKNKSQNFRFDFKNDLYIYPISIEEEKKKLIFSKNSLKLNQFIIEISIFDLYKNKVILEGFTKDYTIYVNTNDVFDFSEIKIKLPINLNLYQYLSFNFYNIYSKEDKLKKKINEEKEYFG
jgi:hypothetical protein